MMRRPIPNGWSRSEIAPATEGVSPAATRWSRSISTLPAVPLPPRPCCKAFLRYSSGWMQVPQHHDSTSPLQGSRGRLLCLPDILDLRVCDMLPQPDTSATSRARDARIDQFDPRSIKRGNQLHERIDVAADHAVAGFHALDRRHRKVRLLSHLPLIDIQERARSPELIGSDHDVNFSQSEPSIVIPCEFHLQASIYRCNISKRPFAERQHLFFSVMAGLVPAIRVFSLRKEDVDARHKAGHDELRYKTYF